MEARDVTALILKEYNGNCVYLVDVKRLDNKACLHVLETHNK